MEKQNTTPPSAITTLAPIIVIAEKFLIAVVAVGVILLITGIDDLIVTFGLAVLALVFFVRGYFPAPVGTDLHEDTEGEPGFPQLLALSITPKVLWIACAVSAVGITFYLVQTPKENYKQMLLIGGTTLAIGSVILTFFLATGMKYVKSVAGVLLRALPLAAVDFYLLFTSGI